MRVEMTRKGALGADLCKKLGCLDSGFRVKGTLSRVETFDPSIVDLHCDKLREERRRLAVRPRFVLPEVVTDGVWILRTHVLTL